MLTENENEFLLHLKRYYFDSCCRTNLIVITLRLHKVYAKN